MPRPRLELIGKRFGRLTALSFAGTNSERRSLWLCKCDCGGEKVCKGSDLVRGFVKSCCFWGDRTNVTKHGMSKSKTYKSWSTMRERCTNPKKSSFKDYGGRGINVCDRWSTFENFYADMGDRPRGMTLERVNPDGNYEPNNCKWASSHEQARNKRSNRRITFNGETRIISDWDKALGFSKGVISNRLKRGWSIQEALTTSSKR